MAFSRRKTPARPRGFGFVEVATAGGADAAVERFDGKGPGGRAPTVGEARLRVERGGGGCYGGGGGGRGGYGGGGCYGVGGGGNREPRRRKEVGGGR